MTAERAERDDDLERLGHVDPPAPGVLDAARDVLWSAVAAEMLATDPAAAPAARHAADRHQDGTRRA